MINYNKSIIQFSIGIEKGVKIDILQIQNTGAIGSCLGCPNIDQRRSWEDFSRIRRKIDKNFVSWKAFVSWKVRALSIACKVVLIKFNLTFVSQYSNNWFKFLLYISNNINKLNKDFFWNNNKVDNQYDGHHFIKSKAWNKVKCEGGFRDKKNLNLNAAYLAKLGWKVLTQPNNLWVQLVTAKYLDNNSHNFFKVRKSSSSYFVWKHTLDHRKLLRKGIL